VCWWFIYLCRRHPFFVLFFFFFFFFFFPPHSASLFFRFGFGALFCLWLTIDVITTHYVEMCGFVVLECDFMDQGGVYALFGVCWFLGNFFLVFYGFFFFGAGKQQSTTLGPQLRVLFYALSEGKKNSFGLVIAFP
jgi:hypothetical protein